MEIFFRLIIFIFFCWLAYKTSIWLWKTIIVPVGKLTYKAIIVLTTIIFFAGLFVFRDGLFDLLPLPLKWLILALLGGIAAIKYLKAKNHL